MKSKFILTVALVAAYGLLSAQWKPVNNFSFHIQPGTLAALGSDTVVVAADNGNIHFSEDGGQSFTKDSLPFPGSWWLDIHFPTPTTGYVCGGTAFGPVKSPIAKTTDGGQTWDSLSGNQFGYDLTAVFFVDENTGYFGGQNFIAKTTDGGQTFTTDTLQQAWRINDLHFTSSSTGFLTSNQEIYKTTDGGQNWNVVFTDTFPSFMPGFGKLDFVTGQTGFALANTGKLLKTTDGGNTWQYSLAPPDSIPLWDFDFVDANTGYAISGFFNSGNTNSFIYKTADGGQSWVTQYSDTSQYFIKISMADASTGYVLGGSSLLATINGGLGLGETHIPEMGVYPNPASESFQLKMPEGVKVEEVSLWDISGREVRNWPGGDKIQSYSLAGLKAGVYSLQLKTSEGDLQQLFLISK